VCSTCYNQTLLPDARTCCPSEGFNITCFNGGSYCSGNGICINNTCACNPGADGTPDFMGPACNVPINKTKKCSQIGATDCQSCLNNAYANGVYCGWCTSQASGTAAALTSGFCSEDVNCVPQAGGAAVQNLYSCQLTVNVTVPPCPDNCTGHGACTNQTNQQTAGTGQSGNTSNVTQVCVCAGGYTGINCGSPPLPISVAAVAGITAGVIAGIVIAIIAFLALAGGGAYAAAQAMGTGGAAPVVNNPLYRGDGNQGMNPLYKA